MAQPLSIEEVKRQLRGRASLRPTDHQPPLIDELTTAQREKLGAADPNFRRQVTTSFTPSVSSKVATIEDVKAQITPQGKGLRHAFGAAGRHGFTGEYMHAFGLKTPEFEEPYEPVGFGEELAGTLGRLSSDLPLYTGAGRIARGISFLPRAGRAGVPLVRTGLQQAAQTALRMGFTFGAPAATTEAIHQAQDVGEIDPVRIAAEGARGFTTGVAVGAGARAPTRLGTLAGEIAGLETGAAAGEQRLPTFEGLAHATAFIGILKLTRALPRNAAEQARMLPSIKKGWESFTMGWKLDNNLEQARRNVDPIHLKAMITGTERAVNGDPQFRPLLDSFADRPGRARIENARKAVQRAYDTGDEYQLAAAEQQLRAAEEDVSRQASAAVAEYNRVVGKAKEREEIAGPGGVVEGRPSPPWRDQRLPGDPTGFRGAMPSADILRNEYAQLAEELQRGLPGDLSRARVAEIDRRMREVSDRLGQMGEAVGEARSLAPESVTRVSRGRAFEGAEPLPAPRPRMLDQPRRAEPALYGPKGEPVRVRGVQPGVEAEAAVRARAASDALDMIARQPDPWIPDVSVPALTWARTILAGERGKGIWTRRHGRAYGAKLGLSNAEMRKMTSKQLAIRLIDLTPEARPDARRLVPGKRPPPVSRAAPPEPSQFPPKRPLPPAPREPTEAERLEQFRRTRRGKRRKPKKPAKVGRPGARAKRGAVKQPKQILEGKARQEEKPKLRTGDPPFKHLRDEAIRLAKRLKDADAVRAIETQYAERAARWRQGEDVESGLQDVVSDLLDRVAEKPKPKPPAPEKKPPPKIVAAPKPKPKPLPKPKVTKQAAAAERALERLAGKRPPKPKGKTVEDFSTADQFAAYYRRNKIKWGPHTGHTTYADVPAGFATKKNQRGKTLAGYAEELTEAGRFENTQDAQNFIEEVIRNPSGTKVPTRGAGADLEAEIEADLARFEVERREREGDFGDMGAALRKGRAVKMQTGPGGKPVPAETLLNAKVEGPGIYGTVLKVALRKKGGWSAQVEVDVAGEKTQKHWVPLQALKVVSAPKAQEALFADQARETEQLEVLQKAEAEARKRELDLPLLGKLTEKTMQAEADAVEKRRLDQDQVDMFDKMGEEQSRMGRGRGSADEQHPDTPKPKPPRSVGAAGPGEMGRLTRQARMARAALSKQLMSEAKRMGLRPPSLRKAEPKPAILRPAKPSRRTGEAKFAEDALVIPKDGLDLSDGERALLMLENANVNEAAARMLGQEGVPKAQIDVLTPAEKVLHVTRRVRAAKHWKHLDNVLTASKYDIANMPRTDIEAVLQVAAQRMSGMPKVPKSLKGSVEAAEIGKEIDAELGEMIQQEKKWFWSLWPARTVLRNQPRILENATEGLRGATEAIKNESNALVRFSKEIIFRDLKGKKIARFGRDDAIIFELVNNATGDPAWIDRPFVTFETTGGRRFHGTFKQGEQAAVKEFHRVSARILRDIYEDFRIRQNLRPEQIRRHYMTHVQSRQIDFRPATLKMRTKIHQLAKATLGKQYDAKLVEEQLPAKLLRNKALQIIDFLEGTRPPKTFKGLKRSLQGILGADELVSIPKELHQPYLKPRKGGEYVESALGALDAYSRYALRKIHLEPTILALRPLIESMPGPGESWRVGITQRAYTEQLVANVLGRPTQADVAVDAQIEHLSLSIGQLKANFPVMRFLLAPLGPAGRFLQRPRAATRVTTAMNRYQYYRLLGVAVDSALTNLTQAVNTYAYYGLPRTVQGYLTLANPFKWGKLRQAHLLQEFEHFFTGPQSIWKPSISRVEKLLLSAFKVAEFTNRGAAYFAGLADAKARGLSFDQGVRLGMGKVSEFVRENMPEHFQGAFYTSEAEWAARKGVIETQFGYSPTEASPVFGKPGGRVLFQFWNYPTQQSAFLWDGVAGRLATGPGGGARAASTLRFLSLLGFATLVAGPVFRNVWKLDVDNIWSVRGIVPHGAGPNVMLAWYLWNTLLDSDWAAKARARQELGVSGEGLVIPRAVRKMGGIPGVFDLPEEMVTHKALPPGSPYRVLPVRPTEEPTTEDKRKRRSKRPRRRRTR